MIIDEDVYLEHFGTKGMHWGVRKKPERTKEEKATRNKKIALIAGTGALAAGAIATAVILKRKGGSIPQPRPKSFSVSKALNETHYPSSYATKWGDYTPFAVKMLDLDKRTADAPKHVVDALLQGKSMAYRGLMDWEKSVGRG